MKRCRQAWRGGRGEGGGWQGINTSLAALPVQQQAHQTCDAGPVASNALVQLPALPVAGGFRAPALAGRPPAVQPGGAAAAAADGHRRHVSEWPRSQRGQHGMLRMRLRVLQPLRLGQLHEVSNRWGGCRPMVRQPEPLRGGGQTQRRDARRRCRHGVAGKGRARGLAVARSLPCRSQLPTRRPEHAGGPERSCTPATASTPLVLANHCIACSLSPRRRPVLGRGGPGVRQRLLAGHPSVDTLRPLQKTQHLPPHRGRRGRRLRAILQWPAVRRVRRGRLQVCWQLQVGTLAQAVPPCSVERQPLASTLVQRHYTVEQQRVQQAAPTVRSARVHPTWPIPLPPAAPTCPYLLLHSPSVHALCRQCGKQATVMVVLTTCFFGLVVLALFARNWDFGHGPGVTTNQRYQASDCPVSAYPCGSGVPLPACALAAQSRCPGSGSPPRSVTYNNRCVSSSLRASQGS